MCYNQRPDCVQLPRHRPLSALQMSHLSHPQSGRIGPVRGKDNGTVITKLSAITILVCTSKSGKHNGLPPSHGRRKWIAQSFGFYFLLKKNVRLKDWALEIRRFTKHSKKSQSWFYYRLKEERAGLEWRWHASLDQTAHVTRSNWSPHSLLGLTLEGLNLGCVTQPLKTTLKWHTWTVWYENIIRW